MDIRELQRVKPEELPLLYLPPITDSGVRGARTFTGLTYALVDGYRPMVLDLHVPADATGPVPLVLWIHGGGWLNGDRRITPRWWPQHYLFDGLIARGMAVATVDYRLASEGGLESEPADCAAALRYLRHFSDELGIDPDRVGIAGESAGGHLAGLLGFVGSLPGSETALGDLGVGSGRIDAQALALLYAPTDIAALLADARAMSAPELDHLNVELAEKPEISPITYVNPNIPPTFQIHGDADVVVSVEQSKALHAKLLEAGVDATLRIVEGAGHCFTDVEPTQHLDEICDFLAAHLAPATS